MAARAERSPARDDESLKRHFESAVRVRRARRAGGDSTFLRGHCSSVSCASRASRLTPPARARALPAQFHLSDYLPSGEYPVHDQRDALRALLRGMCAEELRMPSFLTSYTPVCDEASSAYFVEFSLWTPGVRGGARDSSSGGGVEARPLTAYRPGDPEPWVLCSAATPPSEEACDWHEAVQELFSRCAPGQLRSDYQTLEAVCLARAPPYAVETARCLWEFLTRKKKRAAKARAEAVALHAKITDVQNQLSVVDRLVGLHLIKWRWSSRVTGSADDDSEPVALYTLCTVDADRTVVVAPERRYKELNAAERAFINSPRAMTLLDPSKDIVDAAHLESSLSSLEAELARLHALTDDEYDRLKWLCAAAETVVDFFISKLVHTTAPRRKRPARAMGSLEPPPEHAAADAAAAGEAGGAAASASGAAADHELSELDGSDGDGKGAAAASAWDADLDGEDADAPPEDEDEDVSQTCKKAKKQERAGAGAMRTCKFNHRTGKRCGGTLKPHNSVRCVCDGGVNCRAAKQHAGDPCPYGTHIRCVPPGMAARDNNTWCCPTCRSG